MVEEKNLTFLSNYAYVLIELKRNPEAVLREVSLKLDITERAVQRIVSDLEENGYLTRGKIGRRNTYEIHESKLLKGKLEKRVKVGDFIDFMFGEGQAK